MAQVLSLSGFQLLPVLTGRADANFTKCLQRLRIRWRRKPRVGAD
jgi:hypothetical protein